jgi:gamma-glutamyltranspeptidase/glutathione hydrolase
MKLFVRSCVFAVLLPFFSWSTLAVAAKPAQPAIASAHPLATRAGIDILAKGGNAFDASISVAAVLSVVEPYSAGMGGGGFWLLHDGDSQRNVMVDAREMAPGNATRDMYLDADGEVMREWAVSGPSAAAIPGQAAAFVHVAERYGKLPLADSLAAAIRYAREGFVVDEHYRKMATYARKRLSRYPEARSIFLLQGDIPSVGHVLVQTDLANTLTLLAEKGREGFYAGEVAKKLVAGVEIDGGLWTLDDLKNYTVVEREPIEGTFRGAKIITASPPSSGGVVMLEALNIIDEFNDGEFDPALMPHITVEAMRRAYFDRSRYLGDPDFISMPIEGLLSYEYAIQAGENITVDRATPSTRLGKAAPVHQGDNTTHFSVLDRQGNRVAATLSINTAFGSGYMPKGTGVLLNNEMDDFSAKPGSGNVYGLVGNDANSIAPGKRPLSSMTPTFVEWDGKVAILGTPGGSRIISMVMLAVLDALAGRPPQEWVSRPRFHHQYLPDVVQAEPSYVGSDDAKMLMLRGHKVQSTGRRYGNMQAIFWNTMTGEIQAASDPRGIGLSLVGLEDAANKTTE